MLGEKLVEGRENGQQATISVDKLVIDNNIFVYDDYQRKIIHVGASKSRRSYIEDRSASHIISNQSQADIHEDNVVAHE